jgi:hypothetical protein
MSFSRGANRCRLPPKQTVRPTETGRAVSSLRDFLQVDLTLIESLAKVANMLIPMVEDV